MKLDTGLVRHQVPHEAGGVEGRRRGREDVPRIDPRRSAIWILIRSARAAPLDRLATRPDGVWPEQDGGPSWSKEQAGIELETRSKSSVSIKRSNPSLGCRPKVKKPAQAFLGVLPREVESPYLWGPVVHIWDRL